MSMHGAWITATLDYDATATGEFSGFDADQYTENIDLGRAFDKVTVIIPALDAASTVSVYGIPEDGTAIKTNVPVAIHAWKDADGDGTVLQATASGSGGIIATFDIWGFRYIRLKTSGNQAANRIFYCRGIKL